MIAFLLRNFPINRQPLKTIFVPQLSITYCLTFIYLLRLWCILLRGLRRLDVDVLRLWGEDGMDWLASSDDWLDQCLLCGNCVSLLSFMNLWKVIDLSSQLGRWFWIIIISCFGLISQTNISKQWWITSWMGISVSWHRCNKHLLRFVRVANLNMLSRRLIVFFLLFNWSWSYRFMSQRVTLNILQINHLFFLLTRCMRQYTQSCYQHKYFLQKDR